MMFELIQSIRIADEIATGVAEIAADHPGLLDHFPGHPVLPATWLVELAAQIAGPLAETVAHARAPTSGERWAVLAMIRDAKILVPVPLPARLELEARIERGAGGRVEGRGEAVVDGQVAARGEPFLDGQVAASGASHTRVRVSAWCGVAVVLRADLVFALVEAPPGTEAAVGARRERMARWMRA